MKANLSRLIVAALLVSSVSVGSPLLLRPAAAQQQLVAMADPSAMVILCFRMSPRTTNVDKQAVVNFLMQQGLSQVGFRPNGYECIGQGTCADAMRIMKSQLYVAQLTLSNQMILAYRFDPLPQNPLELNNKARFANVSEAPGYSSGSSSTGTTGGTGTGGNSGYSAGNGSGGAQQGGVQQGGYQYGSGQGELGNGQIGSQSGSQYVRTGSDFGNTGSGYGNTSTGFGNTGTGSQYGGNGTQTNPNVGSSGGGGGSTPIWNQTNGTLSRSGQGNPELYTTNYSNNGTLSNTGLFGNASGGSAGISGNTGGGNAGSFGNTGGGSTGTFGNSGGGSTGNFGNTGTGYGNTGTGFGNTGTGSQYGGNSTQTNPNAGISGGGGGGGTPIWNQSNGTLSRSGQGNPELYTTNYSNNGTLSNTGLFGNAGGGSAGNSGNTGGGTVGAPAYNPNLQNGTNQMPPPIQGTAGPPN